MGEVSEKKWERKIEEREEKERKREEGWVNSGWQPLSGNGNHC